MQNLPRLSHEHHDRLWLYVDQLDSLAGRLRATPLDTTRILAIGFEPGPQAHDQAVVPGQRLSTSHGDPA